MRCVHALAVLALTSFAVVARGAPDGSRAPGESAASSARTCDGDPGPHCTGDATCRGNLVCYPRCPVIPGRVHCEIAGGVCEPRCQETSKTLSGKSFASLDSAHLITFESPTTYRQTTQCPRIPGQPHCDAISVQTGTYHVNGTKISLTSDTGTHDTLRVEPHCYDGLLDEAKHAELYPST